MAIVISVFNLFAGVGVFMVGMKLMSEGLERSAGKGMQKMLGRITNNRFKGMGIGATVTAIVHSSAAVTVMVIGFVNAGIMTLFQATAIILGANIGTTITGLMASFSAFDISPYLGAVALAGVFTVMLGKKEKTRRMGQILSGMGLIFIGLQLMGDAFKGPEFKELIESFFGAISFPILLVLFAILLTAIIQSSTAVAGIVIAMTTAGAIPLECALFVILGADVGTCITSIIASAGANVNAKRTATVQLLFNVFGTVLFTAIVWIFKDPIVSFLKSAIPESAAAFRVSLFHIAFNLTTALMMIPFMKQFIKLVEFLVPDKKGSADDALKFRYIDDRILQAPPIALAQAKKEIAGMAEEAKANIARGMNSVLTRNLSEKESLLKSEDRINFVNKGVAHFLIKLSSFSESGGKEEEIGAFHHVISDIERIGDHAVNLFDRTEEMFADDIVFADAAARELNEMFQKVLAMYDSALSVFETGGTAKLGAVSELENQINRMKKEFGHNHILRVQAGGCSVESGPCFYAIVSSLERIADHLTNIAFSIKSPSGSMSEAMERIAREQRARG
jgi:phosphate:Na+ symporter